LDIPLNKRDADAPRLIGRLNDSLTELLAGPEWRETEAARLRFRKKRNCAVKVEITAQPKKRPIVGTTQSPEELHIDLKSNASWNDKNWQNL